MNLSALCSDHPSPASAVFRVVRAEEPPVVRVGMDQRITLFHVSLISHGLCATAMEKKTSLEPKTV